MLCSNDIFNIEKRWGMKDEVTVTHDEIRCLLDMAKINADFASSDSRVVFEEMQNDIYNLESELEDARHEVDTIETEIYELTENFEDARDNWNDEKKELEKRIRFLENANNQFRVMD